LEFSQNTTSEFHKVA